MIPGHNYRPSTDADRAEEIAERASIMQHDGGMSREAADRAAVACVATMRGEQLELGGAR